MPYTNDQRKDTKEYIVRKDDIAMNVDFGNCHKTTMEDGDGASFFCVSPTNTPIRTYQSQKDCSDLRIITNHF